MAETGETPRTARTSGPESLRGAIDRGETADKVDFSDPAAAPLGTDDEAAGRPVTAEEASLAHRQESRPHLANRPGGRAPDHKGERTAGPLLGIIAVLLVVVGGVGVWFLR